MALFGKKLSLDEILKGIDELSEEDKAQVKSKMEDLYKAEDEREIDKIEEEKAEGTEVKDEKEEEVKDESKEIGEDVDKVETEVENGETVAPTEEKAEETETDNEELDNVEKDNKEDVLSNFGERITSLEAKIEELTALKDKMEEFTRKQAEKFGYKGGIPSGKKDYGEMTADELAKELKSEI